MIYLDYSANTPADPAVLRTFVETEQRYIGNANSTHAAGRAAHARMDEILAHTAQLLGVQPDELIFTSGASEANNLALKRAWRARAAMWENTSSRRHWSILPSAEP